MEDPALYINREMSWLAFNERVLEEAVHGHHPLLERLKFLAIHAANLDEFFMIRVSGLHEQLEAAVLETSPDGLSPREQLTRIREVVERQLTTAYALLTNDLLPSLARVGLSVVDFASLDPEAQERANAYFQRSVFPVLTPLAVDPGHPFPFLSNLSLSLAVEIEDLDSGENKFARVKVPESLPRFVPVDGLPNPHGTRVSSDGTQRYLPLEQLIAANLHRLFPALNVIGCHPFRITRDMDIDILAEEADDLMQLVDREIRRRRFGACVRLEVDRGIPDDTRRFLREKLEIDEEDVYASSNLIGLSSLSELLSLDLPDLKYRPFVPRQAPGIEPDADLFALIRQRDLLVHHPFDSFGPVVDFVRNAARDPQVVAIKQLLYRTSGDSPVVHALEQAVENGKQVAVSIELKARFDEENNIVWAKALERAGAHVFYGAVGSKTHAKMAMVVRREGDQLQRYVHLATGNYNATTARLYTDLGFFSADNDLGDDVAELFNALSGFSKQTRYRKLHVAPTGLADAVIALIDEQTAEASAGRPARIFAKLNSLVDGPVIRALYRASIAGVSIDLVVRGICCLRPGIPGLSDNIRVRSIVGRFLEHERVMVFGVAPSEKMFLSSADWMPRNFYRRVELMFPIEQEPLRAQIRREIIEPSLADGVRAYVLRSDGSYKRVPEDGPGVCSQTLLLEAASQDASRSTVQYSVAPPAQT